MTKNKILIFSATYNETDNIDNFLRSIEELNLPLDILLIDDNSPDGTWKIIQEYSKNKENIHLIIRNNINYMLERKWGRILNCSSIGVKFGGGVNSYNYAFSKNCLEFIPNAHKEWANRNVLINNLRIGVTNTKIHKS